MIDPKSSKNLLGLHLFNFRNLISDPIKSQAPEGSRVHEPVVPDLAQTVKVGSNHSKNSTEVFGGA